MSPTRRIALLSTLSTAPVFAAPFLAVGDNAEVFLTASTQARYEDNVGLDPSGAEQEDLIYEFTPGFELVIGKGGDFTSSLAVYEQFVRYSDLDQLDSELFNLVWKASYTAAKLTVNADASYRQITQNNRNTAGAFDGRRDVISAGSNAEYAFSEKTKAGLGFQYSDTNYRAAAFTDTSSYLIPVNYFYGISPKVDLSAGFRYGQTNVDAVGADSEEFNLNVGARGEYTAKLNGSFDVGYTFRSPDTGSDDGVIAINSGLNYDYSPKTRFTLAARTGFDTGTNGESQKTYGITLGGSTQFTEAFAANASIGYTKINYDITPSREDDFITASVGVTYTFNRHVNLAAAYTHQNNDSNNSGFGFKANVVSLTANLRY